VEHGEQSSIEEQQDKSVSVQTSSQQATILSYIHDLVFGLAAILLVFILFFRVITVNGPSMKQTLKHGDVLILLSNFFYGEPKYGDIVVVKKTSFKDGEAFIKRVIATEGQEVDIDFTKGIVYVDGVALDEPYTNTHTNLFEGNTFPMTVDEGCVFVLGDNRNDSKDSRSPEIGLVDKREIIGKAVLLVLPGKDESTGKREFDRIGVLQ